MSTESEIKSETAVAVGTRGGQRLNLATRFTNPLTGTIGAFYCNVYHYTDGTLEITAIDPYDAAHAYRAFTKEITTENMLRAIALRAIELVETRSSDDKKKFHFKVFGLKNVDAFPLEMFAAIQAFCEYVNRKCETQKIEADISAAPSLKDLLSALTKHASD